MNMMADKDGKVSSMRVINLFNNVAIIGTWVLVCWSQKVIVDFPMELTALLIGSNGMKAYQAASGK